MSVTGPIDVERVICRFADLADPGARAFNMASGEWPLRGFIVRVGAEVRGYINHCPHAGHPLDIVPQRFLTHDGALILCGSHGALFDRLSGYCIAGPCAGRSLQPIALQLESGFVMLADEVDVAVLARSVGPLI